ncbi:MAG: pyroglutamyl-peptidase I [Betaproteobacteria bacterium]
MTGFAPFDGATVNSSWEAVQALDGEQIGGHSVVCAQLPTTFYVSLEQLMELVREHHPALIVCVGQASTRRVISLERVAINVADARIPDNVGAQPIDKPVVSGGQPAYFTSLPIKAMLRDLTEAGLPAEVSQTAGTFVCNHLFYGLMHDLERRRALTGVRGGFIHLPALDGDTAQAMPLQDMQRGLRIAITSALSTTQDVKIAAGSPV